MQLGFEHAGVGIVSLATTRGHVSCIGCVQVSRQEVRECVVNIYKGGWWCGGQQAGCRRGASLGALLEGIAAFQVARFKGRPITRWESSHSTSSTGEMVPVVTQRRPVALRSYPAERRNMARSLVDTETIVQVTRLIGLTLLV